MQTQRVIGTKGSSDGNFGHETVVAKCTVFRIVISMQGC